MLRAIVLATLILVASAATALADAKEDLLAAVKRIADSENYSWTTTAEGAAGGGGGSQGKTQKDGLTLLDLTMRNGTARVLFKGDKGAFETPDAGWQSVASQSDEPGPAQMIAYMIKTYQPPAAQAMNLASKAKDLHKTEDGALSGTLGPDDAKALIQRRVGRRAGADMTPPDIKDAKATVTFWMADGMLTKFQFNLQGSMTIQGESRDINRTTTVQIREVGTTKIDVPEEAKAKMG